MSMAVTVLFEEVYSDGSGSAGTYSAGGLRFSGIHTGERVVVTPLGVPTGFRSEAEKRKAKRAREAVEAHVEHVNSGIAKAKVTP